MQPINEHIKRMKDLEPNLKNIRTLNTGTGKVEFKSLLEIFTPMFANRNSKPKKRKIKLTELQIDFNNSVDAYIKKFVEKHGYEFSYWVSDEVGGIACFIEEYYINFSDIKYDIDKKVKKDLIFQWSDDCAAHYLSKKKGKEINFKSYAMGLRFEDIKNNK